MESDIETLNGIDLDEIQLGIYNVEPGLADIPGAPTSTTGLSVTFLKKIGSDNNIVSSQSFVITEEDITGNILLTLNFNDETNQFTGTFSLDGGKTFQSPFSPIDTRVDEGKFI